LRPSSGAAFSDWKTEQLVIYLRVAPFKFSGEFDPESGHVREYVLDARINRSPRCFGAMQGANPAIQRIGHLGLPLSSAWAILAEKNDAG
jgi:hypothetical protein